MNKSDIVNKLAQKSLPYKYAETLLKGDKEKHNND